MLANAAEKQKMANYELERLIKVHIRTDSPIDCSVCGVVENVFLIDALYGIYLCRRCLRLIVDRMDQVATKPNRQHTITEAGQVATHCADCGKDTQPHRMTRSAIHLCNDCFDRMSATN